MRFTKARNKVKNLVCSAKKKYRKEIDDKYKYNPKPDGILLRVNERTDAIISNLRIILDSLKETIRS